MATNYLYAGNRLGPVQQFIQGFAGGQQIMGNIARNNLMQQQAERDKLITAMKLHDEMKGMTYNNLDFYNNQYRPMLIKVGVPEGMLPQYENVDDLNKGLYQTEMIKAKIKNRLEGPKAVSEYGAIYEDGQFKYPEISPARREQINVEREKIQAKFKQLEQQYGYQTALKMMGHEMALKQINARSEKAPKEFAPTKVTLEDGTQAWAFPDGRVEPIKGAVEISKAGQQSHIREKAAQMAVDAMLTPGTPEYESAVEANIKILSGQSRKSDQKKPYGWKGPAYYFGPDGKEVPIRTEEEYKRIFK